MQIELKRIEYSERLSQETWAFAADVWIDGVKRGTVQNEGHGGCHMYWGPQLLDDLEAYAQTLPPDAEYGFAMDADSVINAVMCAWLMDRDKKAARRKFDKDITTRILWLKPDGVYPSKKFTTAQIQKWIAPDGPAHKHAAAENIQILNLLPRDEAFETWYKAVYV